MITDSPNIISIDTSSKECSMSVFKNRAIVAQYNFHSKNNLSANIIGIMDFLLKQTDLELSNIDAFGVCIGPGIFTGIRVGLSTVKGLCFGTEKKIFPVNSLEAIAHRYRFDNNKIISIIDAKRGYVYSAGYKITNQKLVPFLQPALLEINELNQVFNTEEEYLFAGSGASEYKDFLSKRFPQSTNIGDVNFLSAEITEISYSKLSTEGEKGEVEKLIPLYIRKTDAEENYARNNKKNQTI